MHLSEQQGLDNDLQQRHQSVRRAQASRDGHMDEDCPSPTTEPRAVVNIITQVYLREGECPKLELCMWSLRKIIQLFDCHITRGGDLPPSIS